MDAIKSFLKPGAKEEDATMYGSEAERAHAERQTATLASDSQATKNSEAHLNKPIEEPGIARQLVNPNHDKYNEAQYGPAGSTTAAETLPPSVPKDATLYTTPEAKNKEGGVLRQILNPGGTRHDDVAYGTTATTSAPSKAETLADPSRDSGGISRQILNPSGHKYDETTHGAMSSTNQSTGLTGNTNNSNLTSSAINDGTTGTHTTGTSSSMNNPNDLPHIPATGGEFLSGSNTGVSSGSNRPLSSTGQSALSHGHLGKGHNYDGPNLGREDTPPADSNNGPHKTRIANLLDPHINSSGSSTGVGSSTTGLGSSTTGHSSSTTGLGSSTTGSSHLGRDAALVGGAGAVGGAAYGSSNTGPAPNTIGQHDKDWKNVLDPRVTPDLSQQTSSSTTGQHTSGSAIGAGTTTGSSSGENSSGRGVSHATGDSKVPMGIQRAVPESLERALPDSIHDTSGASRSGTTGAGVSGHDTADGSYTSIPRRDFSLGTSSDPATQHGVGRDHTKTHDDHSTLGSSSIGSDTTAAPAGSLSSGSIAKGTHATSNLPPAVNKSTAPAGSLSSGSIASGTHATSNLPPAVGDSSRSTAPAGSLASGSIASGTHATSNLPPAVGGSHTNAAPAGSLSSGSIAKGTHATSNLPPAVSSQQTTSGSHTGLPHREFALGSTNDPATQHGVGRDHTSTRDNYSSTGATTAGVGGLAAGGLAAGSAAHHHGSTTGASPVIGERGLASESANPYSSKGLDSRVDQPYSGTTSGGNDTGRGVSHATGKSVVPESVQRTVPTSVERALPNSVHDTSGSSSSHAAAGTTGKQFQSQSPNQTSSSNSQQNTTQPDPKHGHHYIPHRQDHQQPEHRDTPSMFTIHTKDAKPPVFGDERPLDEFDYHNQGGAQEHRGLGEHRSHEIGERSGDQGTRSAVANDSSASGNVGHSGNEHPGVSGSGSHGVHDDSHDKKQGFFSKLLHRHKDDETSTEHNKLHKDQH